MVQYNKIPDSKVHGANIGPIWGRQDPGGPHVTPINFAFWDIAYNVTVNVSQEIWELTLTKDTPYLALTGKLWGVFCEHFVENPLR